MSYLGYKNKEFPLSELKSDRNKLKLDMLTVSLAEVNVLPKDANQIVREVDCPKKRELYTRAFTNDYFLQRNNKKETKLCFVGRSST